MSYKLLVLKSAALDIEDAFRYYLDISAELAIRFEAAMDKAMEKLKKTPYNYFNLDDGRHRRIQVEGFPYMFIYEIEQKRVVVKMLFHQKNDPEIQSERLIE
ncbi:MAG: type II toxin-antitoxin system RelE/ParE family toxin [Chitinophagaceae bacterium]|jgi:plasmid stabilization system protein ParE|nr:type II toxin-antitoxin system RelE/ParE family toxin [Chitinophagaceae bacterium]